MAPLSRGVFLYRAGGSKVERWAFNPQVVGSIPTRLNKEIYSMIELWTSIQMLAIVFGFLGCGYVVGSAIECDSLPSTPAPECQQAMIYPDDGCNGSRAIDGCVAPSNLVNGEIQISLNL